MSSNSFDPGFECEVVWVVNPALYERVRESVIRTPRRAGAVGSGYVGGGFVVAYSVLDKNAPKDSDGKYVRRCWWVGRDDSVTGCSETEGIAVAEIRKGVVIK